MMLTLQDALVCAFVVFAIGFAAGAAMTLLAVA